MKKLMALAAVLLLVLTLAACKRETLSASSLPTVPTDTPLPPSEKEPNDLQDPENTEYGSTDGARVEFESITPRVGVAEGIDVSKWQGKIDWKKVKQSGVDFAVIRIGYRGENGKIYSDDYADYNLQQADAVGLVTGVYFFSTAVTVAEAADEAAWVCAKISGYPVSFVAYDCEGFLQPDSRMFGLSNTQRTDNALSFINTVKARGYTPLVYAAVSDLEGGAHFETARLEQACGIWVAHYPDVPYPQTAAPAYGGQYDMWQYTNRGSVPGVLGNCDMIVSYKEFKKQNAKQPQNRPQHAQVPKQDDGYTAVNEKVTAKEMVNLRDAASTSSNIVGSLKNGEVLTRTAVGKNGWSKLSYGGKTVYAISSYLTTDISYSPPVSSEQSEFAPCNEQVTAKIETNLRSTPSSSGSVVATIKNGEFVKRTGLSSRGWSRLEYKGQTVYAVTSLLTDKVTEPPQSSETPSVSTSSGFKTQFETVNEQVTAKSETNLRNAPSATDSEVVYTLKNGEFVTRTGVASNGWSRVEWNGQTLYAVSSYLTVQ